MPNQLMPNEHSGFRLHRLEVLNWGTFDRQVWRMTPGGHTALLTGENGSGKSTLVDALLTLLVPNQKRNYNQAAGTAGKRERDERSYVLGAYGRVQRTDDYGGQTQYLRGANSYSVLLAHFHHAAADRAVTLAQVFWHQDGVQKFFVVAQAPLEIATHFSNFTDIAALKKRLRSQKAEVFDQFTQYSQRFRRFFGLRSEKALELFNQTVMIKEIRRLNDFVRDHMLEKTDAQDKVRGLYENYENLTRAHEAIQKAERQLALLEPLMGDAGKYQQAEADIAELSACEALTPVYFAARKEQLLQSALEQTVRDLLRLQNQQRASEQRLAGLRQQETDLSIAIAGDETGRQLQALMQEMNYAAQEVKRRQNQVHQYDELAQLFDLPRYCDEATFYQTRRQAEAHKPALEQQLQQVDDSLGRLLIEQNQVNETWQSVTAELASLNQRQSQIPSQNLTLRSQILDALQMPESAVPFIGELLRVREKERAWEGAVERLLHNFGLRLLVPEEHYSRFSRYVNQTNLRGRLIFHRVALDATYAPPRAIADNALIHKLQIKPDTAYYGWIEHELQHQFDYLCCESMSDFDRAAKAITPSGLTKSGGSRHEKDDRRDLHDRRGYILGWTNANKIRALQQEVTELEQQRQRLATALDGARRQQRHLRTLHQRLDNLLRFDTFAAIDWQSEDARRRGLADQKARLEQSSNRLQQLQTELRQIQGQVTAEEQELRSVVKSSGQVDHQRQQYQHELYECQRELEQRRQALLAKVSSQIEQLLKTTLTLVNINSERRQIEEHYRQARSTAERRRNTHMGTLIKLMQEYKSTYPDETADFDASVNAIPDFARELLRIRQDDLPRYRERFKSLLNEKVIENIALLHGDLYRYQEEIEENIATLNASLRTINYTADTYIQLHTEASRDIEIRAFKQEMQACLPDVGRQQQDADYEASFRRIQALITKFKEEARWTDKVTDVRQWLDFAATERYRADDSSKEYYSDSAGKSGGQKAKLAYTILASAIAYQYGLKAGEAHSGAFRFVVIDEAFSRSDQENSRYAMALFKELALQLLVVTPMTGIHIVEPYIAACHFVFNNSEGNNSQVETMTIQQLRAHRLVFHNGTGTEDDHTTGDYSENRTPLFALPAQ